MRTEKKEIITRQSGLEILRFIKRSMQQIFSLVRINSRNIGNALNFSDKDILCLRFRVQKIAL